jgi:hypothetical protein
MKKISYLFLIVFTFLSCEDQETVDTPDFEISFNETAKVGEPIRFDVQNTPNFLNFYAGDFGHQYKYKDRTNAEGIVTMSFLNSQKWGLGPNKEGALSVFYSKDYEGTSTKEAVQNATWIDITERFNISKLYDFTLQDSGIVDITDLADGSPIYFGFRYLCDNVGTRPSEWYLDELFIQMEVPEAPEPLTVATEDKPGFNPVDVEGIVEGWNANKWYFDTQKGENGLWRMRGQAKVDGDWIANEDWLITHPINLTKVNPDQGLPLKTYSEKLESFEYTYSKPGNYTITFIGSNETIYGQETVIKEYDITITE